MNESAIKGIANEQMPLYTALRGFVNSTNYINIGVISRVHSENYVDVNLYYNDNTGKKVQIRAVRLLHIGTTKCKLIVTPAVGDNVLLLCPKDFIEKLEYNRFPRNSNVSYLPYGNINMCGILIKDESDTNVKSSIEINEKGDISVVTDGKISVENKDSVSVKTSGAVSIQCVKSDDTARATFNIDDDGKVDVETKGDISVVTDGDASVTAGNVVAMCSSFVVKADENSDAVFEVTTGGA